MTTLEGIHLPIDAYIAESAKHSAQLKSIEPDGSLSYQERKSVDAGLTETLERVWNEYPDGLLDITEEKLEKLPADDLAVQKRDEGPTSEEQPHDRSKMMAWDDMEKLRSDIYLQLNEARNELWFVLELAKTLGLSSSFKTEPPPASNEVPPGRHPKQKHSNREETKIPVPSSADAPILPPGTYTVTPGNQPARPLESQILDMQLALAAKHEALDECSALIDSAVDEMLLMADAGDRFWGDVRTLRNGIEGKDSWAMVPRPDFGKTMAVGEKAKDIIIPYALDEAPRSIRLRCMAAFDLDPAKKDALTFGTRTYQRLRVTLSGISGSATSTLDPVVDDSDIRALMAAAQLESIEEELFTEIQAEVSRLPNGSVGPNYAYISAAEQELRFEMYDPRVGKRGVSESSICDFIVLTARLYLFSLHRERKARQVDISQPLPSTSIVRPILNVLQFYTIRQRIDANLEMFASTLKAAGLRAEMRASQSTRGDAGHASARRMLSGMVDADALSATTTLECDGWHGVAVELTAPSNVRITTSRSAFSLGDLEELPFIVAEDLACQLLERVHKHLEAELPEENKAGLLLDQLEGVIRLDDKVSIELSIPPPFNSITTAFSQDAGPAVTWDPQEDSDLFHWVLSTSRDALSRNP